MNEFPDDSWKIFERIIKVFRFLTFLTVLENGLRWMRTGYYVRLHCGQVALKGFDHLMNGLYSWWIESMYCEVLIIATVIPVVQTFIHECVQWIIKWGIAAGQALGADVIWLISNGPKLHLYVTAFATLTHSLDWTLYYNISSSLCK